MFVGYNRGYYSMKKRMREAFRQGVRKLARSFKNEVK
jgi:hypothetical protein